MDTLLRKQLAYSLQGIANDYEAWFDIIEDEDEDSGKNKKRKKNAVAELISEGDHIQWADNRYGHELASCIHSNRSLSRDGMPGYSHEYLNENY